MTRPVFAAYDLETWQPSFTVLEFAMGFGAWRRERGNPAAEVQVTPGVSGEFGRFKYWPNTLKACRQWRDAVCVPILRMIGPPVQVRVLKDRPKRFDFYDYMLGPKWSGTTYYEAFAAGVRPLRSPVQLRPGNHVTITLRECGQRHWTQRDSNLRAWVEAGKLISQRTARPVLFVRDSGRADERIVGVQTVPAASKSMNQRAQLYAEAALNLGVNNGPMWLAFALDAPVMMFKPATEGAGKSHGVEHVRRAWGIEPGQQLRGAKAHQRLVWQSDDDPRAIADAAEGFLS